MMGIATADETTAPPAGRGERAAPGDLGVERALPAPRSGGIEGGARAIAFSPDGRLLAIGAACGEVSIADVSSTPAESPWRPVLVHEGAVSALAFAARGDERVLASGGDDGFVRAALVSADGAVVSSSRVAIGAGPVTALALDGERAVAGTARGAIALARLAPPSVERTVDRHDGPIAAIALVKSRIATAGWDGLVKLSDATGREVRSAKVAPVELSAIALVDGKLAVASWRPGIAFLDATSLKPVASFEPHRGGSIALATLPGGRLVSASLADESVVVSELASKSEPRAIARSRVRSAPSAIAVSPDGARIACALNDGSVVIFHAPAGGR
jgi:WD40 repeat protein